MVNQRARIKSHIANHPGIHFNQILRELNLATGQGQYHLRKLIKGDEIERADFYGRTHYFPPECNSWERGAIALARRESARDILFYLFEYGPSRPGDVATELNIARSTLEWHLGHLVEHDIVRKKRDIRNHVTVVLIHPEETAHVLRTVTPSLSETLVDRFIRLTDNMFDP